MAGIATDMFVGRERFATVLLMRLTETVILWLSDDQTFWGEIEEGPKPLGPLGLQQVHFDMPLSPPRKNNMNPYLLSLICKFISGKQMISYALIIV